ncbi:MAG: 23S rRNA (adenine(2503)-C(2))-methyltransferase RlmN [Deltaproteobacteria bacterium]|nr:23S rRNA (adenine(2503)-C(2))-methyltransferase RlmN [Deltaproteobacteria bacterium]
MAPSLLAMTCAEMERLAVELDLPGYRGRQLFAAIFAKNRRQFAEMTTLPRPIRDQLASRFELDRPTVEARQLSADGSRKYRLQAKDGARFEAVYLPEVAAGRKTNTLCVSSQSGCSLGCAFCFTASLKRHRNLHASEIVGQLMVVRDDLEALGPEAQVSNVVFMGMGEPLLNFAEVVQSARILMDGSGLGYAPRRVTVSTAGVVPRLADLGRALPVQVAISLNATTDAVRDRIMPINRKWPLATLIDALRHYPLPHRRRFTIEYVLLDGVNDSLDDARRLPKLLAGIPVKVNLLPLNAHPRTSLASPPAARVAAFQTELRRAGMNAIVRTARGRDIAAACGQLGDEALTPAGAADVRG